MHSFKKKLLFYATLAISSSATGILVSAGALPGSYGGGCALASKKIYCYGGSVQPDGFNVFTPSSDFFALDVSGPINAADNASSWQILTSGGDVRPTSNILFGSAALPSGDGFVISGGVGYNDGNTLSYPTMMYNATTNTWTSIPTNFLQTSMAAMATDYKNGNQVFMFGGRSYQYTGYRNTSEYETYPAQAKILGYQNSIFNWVVGPNELFTNGMVSGRMRHSAVQGADGKFYIIGGEYSQYTVNTTGVPTVRYALAPVNMSEVLVYDINTGWSAVPTNGALPSPRWHHTTTLLPSGKILLLGGCRSNFYAVNETYWYMVPSTDFMFTLDTATMTWADQTSAVHPAPGGSAVSTQQVARCFHQSVLVGEDSLFVLNGRVDKGEFANTFYILNTTSWVLSNSFPGLDAPPTTSDNNSPTNDAGTTNPTDENGQNASVLSGGAIGGVVVGVIAGVALLLVAGFFYRKRQKGAKSQRTLKMEQMLPYSNSDSNDPPPGYSDGSAAMYNQSSPSSPLSYGNAIKPEANDAINSAAMPFQKIVLSPVKPDGA